MEPAPDPPFVQAVVSQVIRDQYASFATSYDHLLWKLGYETPMRMAHLLHERYPQGGRLLELGAGTGLVGRYLEQLGSPLQLVATDLSAAMLEVLLGSVYVELHVLDATLPLPFEPASFQGVLCAGLLEYIVMPRLLFANILPVLAPGGQLFFTFAPAVHCNFEPVEADQLLLRHHPQAVRDSLDQAGMQVDSETPIEAYWNRGVQIMHHLVAASRKQEGVQ